MCHICLFLVKEIIQYNLHISNHFTDNDKSDEERKVWYELMRTKNLTFYLNMPSCYNVETKRNFLDPCRIKINNHILILILSYFINISMKRMNIPKRVIRSACPMPGHRFLLVYFMIFFAFNCVRWEVWFFVFFIFLELLNITV